MKTTVIGVLVSAFIIFLCYLTVAGDSLVPGNTPVRSSAPASSGTSGDDAALGNLK